MKRHVAHHNDNIKYGYIVFGMSAVYALVLAVANGMYDNCWGAAGTPPRGSLWAALRSVKRWWIHVLVWVVAVAVLAFFHVEEPAEHYLTIAKRVGRLLYLLVPLDVFLAMRPSLLINSYLELVTLHKWLLRLIITCCAVHATGFCVKWALAGVFWDKVLSIKNVLGVAMLLPALGLAVVSIRPVRRRAYRVFYLWHNVVIFLLLVPTYWHARPGVSDFILLLVAVLAFQAYQRLSKIYTIDQIRIVDNPGSSLQVLKLPKPPRYPTWHPGAHVRLSYPMKDPRFWLFPSHPYTVFSHAEDASLDLVVRKGLLFQVYSSLSYTLSGPSSALPPLFYETAKNVVVLCGGSGISLGAPLHRDMLIRAPGCSKLVWCVTHENDTFVLNDLGFADSLDIYVTRAPTERDVFKTLQHEQSDTLLHNDELHELHSLELVGSSVKEERVQENQFKQGRPRFDEIFAGLVSSENSWIVVCGPAAMIKEATRWSDVHNVLVFSEHYCF
ncbi:hypothetical protein METBISCDRAFT_15415 [Metschnikowia bicuspidata]|uniref:FAD-binding FR-type domain-containing protein n=1 Tax=Metschnikowia bicuspidata TaxID=27322 RepID=A0A4P9ZDI1_9ASCO|nr:hypothetical protein METBISCDRAFT_15415 [Metschnikowia bicuspidata]